MLDHPVVRLTLAGGIKLGLPLNIDLEIFRRLSAAEVVLEGFTVRSRRVLVRV